MLNHHVVNQCSKFEVSSFNRRDHNHALFWRGVIYYLFGKTWYSLIVYKIWHVFALAIPEIWMGIWMGPSKFKVSHMTYPCLSQGQFVVCRRGLATIYLVQNLKSLHSPIAKIRKATKNAEIGVVWGLVTPQGHRQWPFSRAYMTSYLTLIVTMLYRFRVIVNDLSKIAYYDLPHLHLSPHRRWSRSNFAEIFWVRKLSELLYGVVCVILSLAILI